MDRRTLFRLLLLAGGTVLVAPAQAGETTKVAVASNFTDAAQEIAKAFADTTDHEAVLAFGATGQLYTQITQGAPFEVFLSADDMRPALLVREGLGVAGSAFTYAVGRLVLYSADEDMVSGPDTLITPTFSKIAIANPETAPYGRAAIEVMQALGVDDALRAKIVQGQNIAQTFQFIETGNAELGFIAYGQVSRSDSGSKWVVPQERYSPIRQDAVLLKPGENNPAAIAFLEFLRSKPASAILEKHGYARGDQPS